MVFHDTNLTQRATRRILGGINRGWNNSRGVMAAIEEYFNVSVDEDSIVTSEAKETKI